MVIQRQSFMKKETPMFSKSKSNSKITKSTKIFKSGEAISRLNGDIGDLSKVPHPVKL